MVVAEVPMWVVHSNNNNMVGAANASASNPSSQVSLAMTLSPHKRDGGEGSKHRYEHRAMASLSLLEGLGGIQKSAIYSLDIHPEGQRFATGGGDGAVRIWNTHALFAQAWNNKDTASTASRMARYKEGGSYESSGESSAGEDSHTGNIPGQRAAEDSASESSLVGEEEAVRDLSSLVRRKKDGTPSTPTQKPKAATTNATNTTTGSPANSQIQTPSPSKPQTQQTSHSHGHRSHHRLLCTLSAHTGSSVLSVRFSTNGNYLASAGDDAVVCIYKKDDPAKFGETNNLEHSSVEHWTRIKLCRGHALDVVGLAWAPDDSHLVSCSLDSNAPIIVWKLTDLASNAHRPTHSNVLVNPYKILGKGIHTSMVKGVTFDPAGTYLASSGDDPSVCVWRAHDDWGLERRIDADAGIFRQWKEQDAQSLSSQSLFRRLDWSTDGSYICSTNAVVKNKHVASTISRDGWAVSSAKSTASGAANLVGHKQPVVACRHCPFLLDSKSPDEEQEDDDEEPDYATLVALGDKRGFVTIWSTRRSRPVFKIQCSETRCTVTDLAWGKVQGNIILLVSLLDGQMVALKFGVPDELGHLLRPKAQARVFQLRYGIDLNDTTDVGGNRRLFVGGNSGPKLIENALQYSLEDADNGNDDEEDTAAIGNPLGDTPAVGKTAKLSSAQIKATQSETRSRGGKKRIQPLLMSVDSSPAKRHKATASKTPTGKKKADTLEDAMELATKAAAGAEAATAGNAATNAKASAMTRAESNASHKHHHHHASGGGATETPSQVPPAHMLQLLAGAQTQSPQIPFSTDRIHSVDLPIESMDFGTPEPMVADCTNSIQVPTGSKGSALPCTVLTISRAGKAMWKDQLPGTSCSTIAASKSLLAVGTSDGCVQLYGTSPSLGWKSASAFRSHPPFVFGRPIVSLQLHERSTTANPLDAQETQMLVVSADGSFAIYSVMPHLKVLYKGTIMPPMSHMLLSSDMSNELHLPKLARVQLTETNQLILLLSLQSSGASHRTSSETTDRGRNGNAASVGAGGSLQAFVYERSAEIWMRVADSRFVLSDFYSTLPTSSKSAKGTLFKLEDSVRLGAMSSTLQSSRKSRSHADAVYQQSEHAGSDLPTRAHCEDRLACSVALESKSEFEYWLSRYARTLVMSGNEGALRILVDLLTGKPTSSTTTDASPCWWLSEASTILGLDRKKLIQSRIIPEMSKNRALQRMTNEIAVELDTLMES